MYLFGVGRELMMWEIFCSKHKTSKMTPTPASRIPIILFFLTCVLTLSAQEYAPPNNTLRTTLRKQTWEKLKLKTPKKQKFMTSLVFNTNQCFDLYEQAAAQKKWPIYEPVTILTFRDVILHEAIRGSDYSDAEIQEAYETTKEKYQSEKPDTGLNKTELQQKYDPIILEALWIVTLNEFIKGRNDDVKNLARQMLSERRSTPNEENLVTTKPKTSPKREPTPEPSLSKTKTPAVHDVILRTVTNYGLSGAYVENEVSILFKNGELMTNPNKPTSQLDVTASKKKNPKKWATWKKYGTSLSVTKAWKNKTYEWKKWFKVRPGQSSKKLVGRYTTLDGFGGATVVNASMVSFDAQGKFAWKTVKGGNTSWKPIYSNQTSAGTYQLNDYEITLTYNNGTTESFFFGFYPKDDQHFVIGSSHFAPLKK